MTWLAFFAGFVSGGTVLLALGLCRIAADQAEERQTVRKAVIDAHMRLVESRTSGSGDDVA